jgi:hypothetical protein
MTLRSHYWLTIFTFVVVFAAGIAFALILFDRKVGGSNADKKVEHQGLDMVPQRAWAEATMSRLKKSLELRPDQIEAIQKDIRDAELEVEYVREGAMLEYFMLLMRLHDTISNKVDEAQKEKLKKSRAELQRAFEYHLSSITKDREGQEDSQPPKAAAPSETP